MTAGYQLTEGAETELGDLLHYIAEQDGVERALHIHGEFARAFEHLASMPASGSKRREFSGERVRWWRVFRWVVIYDPETSPITILRVIHGARELDRILGPDI